MKMEKYSLRDLATNKFTLLNDFDIVRIHDVESVTVRVTDDKKVVTIHVGPYDYFFNKDLKSAVSTKIASDLNDPKTVYRFAI
jgi:hypothetical protein